MDLVLRAAFGFLFVFFLTRVVGRRELSSLEPFDLILLVMLGDLVQQGITQNDFSVTGMVLVGGTVALLTVLVSYTSFRFPRLRPLLDGEPVIVVEDGKPLMRNLARNRITLDELAAAARLEGIAELQEVRWAVLETSGSDLVRAAMTLYLSEADVDALLGPDDALAAVEGSFLRQARGAVENLPARTSASRRGSSR